MLKNKALAAAPAAVPQYIEDVFSTYLYTGNNTDRTIINGIDLSGKGGMVWFKSRSGTQSHGLFDTARGVNNILSSNTTDAANTDYSNRLTAFNENGFSLGQDLNSPWAVNDGNRNYASWTFRKAPKFFDVVTYTGNGVAGRTVAHSLGSVPGMIIVKNTGSTSSWAVYHRSTTATQVLFLNADGAAQTVSSYWNNTEPTSTVFTLGDAGVVNNSGSTYVAYLFAHDAGGFGDAGDQSVVSCGSFTAIDGVDVSVTLGYEPQYLLVKQSSGAGGAWDLFDNMRGFTANSSGSTGVRLQANSANAESTTLLNQFIPRPTATGFIAGSSLGATTGNTFIYLAIRRGPMKTPTVGTEVFTPVASTGTGANATVASGFVTDTVIEGNRASSTAGTKFGTWDRLRGINALLTTSTSAEIAGGTTTIQANPWDVMNGYKVGTTSLLTNASSNTFINWMFRRAPGFFDVVCYTGTGVARTVNHNLGVAPELIIVKRRSGTQSWFCYAASLGSTEYLLLNTAASSSTDATIWNSTNPTSTVFSLGTLAAVNASASTYVAYLFATLPGVSKVGSYTGTGATQQINCGFTTGARFVMIKRTDSTGNWYVYDTARGIISGNDPYLALNSTAAEVTNTDWVDPLASGFELSNAGGNLANTNGVSYIFLAVA